MKEGGGDEERRRCAREQDGRFDERAQKTKGHGMICDRRSND